MACPQATAWRDWNTALTAFSADCWAAKHALDRFPRAVFTVMRLPVTWAVLQKLMLGDVAHPGEARGAGRRALKLIEGLGRVAAAS